ncbi:hypothetical protein GWO43_04100 [candidate division KSB1 bacterium]|nr:hypothetical protein [candidate division KSB1 bacterium]NIR70768.1 hypothetical protein [candidate division KSB1 bacterium]NIS23221.1 hypothetical protein [candidate division KSB1 bacterium]NIT70081.1 hypothetical protein [candidate division KSB1 bacterium]NIU23718.1 hypothetical protein [candidate division KSB1 bacterium]
MQSQKLKQSLLQIAEQITDSTTLEDVYKELALLADIEESEEQEARGEVYTQAEVEKIAKQWQSN